MSSPPSGMTKVSSYVSLFKFQQSLHCMVSRDIESTPKHSCSSHWPHHRSSDSELYHALWQDMCQSWVEIEHFSVVCFDHVTVFEALYLRTSVKGGADTNCVDSWIPNTSVQCVWALPLMVVLQYNALSVVVESKCAKCWISICDSHIWSLLWDTII